MSGKIATLIGVAGAAAAGVWPGTKHRRLYDPVRVTGMNGQGMLRIQVDDDTAAEIIRHKARVTGPGQCAVCHKSAIRG